MIKHLLYDQENIACITEMREYEAAYPSFKQMYKAIHVSPSWEKLHWQHFVLPVGGRHLAQMCCIITSSVNKPVSSALKPLTQKPQYHGWLSRRLPLLGLSSISQPNIWWTVLIIWLVQWLGVWGDWKCQQVKVKMNCQNIKPSQNTSVECVIVLYNIRSCHSCRCRLTSQITLPVQLPLTEQYINSHNNNCFGIARGTWKRI